MAGAAYGELNGSGEFPITVAGGNPAVAADKVATIKADGIYLWGSGQAQVCIRFSAGILKVEYPAGDMAVVWARTYATLTPDGVITGATGAHDPSLVDTGFANGLDLFNLDDYGQPDTLVVVQNGQQAAYQYDGANYLPAGSGGNPAPHTVPNSPTTVAGTPGDTTVGLTWVAPVVDGGTPITDYKIIPYIGAAAQSTIDTASTTASATVTGLTNGVDYTFRVLAINAVGSSIPSLASAVITPHA